jgi:hypothetical protein
MPLSVLNPAKMPENKLLKMRGEMVGGCRFILYVCERKICLNIWKIKIKNNVV